MAMSGVQILLLALLLLWPVSASGSEAKSTGVPADSPAISLADAVEMAQAFVARAGADVGDQYIHAARLEYEDGSRIYPDGKRRKGQYWYVHWRWARPRLGGEISVRVFMDGEILLERHGP
jgi:hypothetical protein